MGVHRKNALLTLSVMICLCPWPAWSAGNTDLTPDPIDTFPIERDSGNNHPETPIFATRNLAKEAKSLGLGYWFGSLSNNSNSDNLGYLRYSYSEYPSGDFAREYGLQLTSSGLVGWRAGFKKIFEIGQYMEPYAAVFGGALYQPSESFATLINWQRYQLNVEGGLEDFLRLKRQARTQFGISYSALGLGGYIGFLYAY